MGPATAIARYEKKTVAAITNAARVNACFTQLSLRLVFHRPRPCCVILPIGLNPGEAAKNDHQGKGEDKYSDDPNPFGQDAARIAGQTQPPNPERREPNLSQSN